MNYELSNGMMIEDEKMSSIMEFLVDNHVMNHPDYTWDNIGMATLLCDVYRDTIRYCPQNREWYIWDEAWRRQDDDGIVLDKLQTLLNLLVLYQREEPNEKYEKYLHSLRNYRPMINVIETLKTLPEVRMNIWDMDSNPYLLNTVRGAFNLLTGERIEDVRAYNVTKKTASRFPDFLTIRCDRWYEFIDQIMSGDKEKAAFLQRALGYSILGVNREECMFIAYGAKTRNGKGTLFSSIAAALGSDYVGAISPDLICEKKGGKTTDFNAPQPALSKITGCRLVTMAEGAMGVMLDSVSIKTLTGRDKLTTRGLYEKPYEFTAQFTMWMNTNYLPNVNDLTVFDSNRIWVIPFEEQFVGGLQDKDLKEVFAAPENRPTILKWLYEGCIDYLKNGLNVPESVRRATNEYREMHDKIGRFLSEACDVTQSKAVSKRGDLYASYRAWCLKAENKYSPMGSTSFYSEVKKRGFELAHRPEGWYFKGVLLK